MCPYSGSAVWGGLFPACSREGSQVMDGLCGGIRADLP